MSKKVLKKQKGDVFALPLPDGGYIYIYYITGNASEGDLISVFNYSSKELETDIQKIILQPSLYNQNPFIGILDLEADYIKVGNVKPNFDELMKHPIYMRSSIEEGRIWAKMYRSYIITNTNDEEFKAMIQKAKNNEENPYDGLESNIGDYKKMLQDLKEGKKHICNDWSIIEYRITTSRGKLEHIRQFKIGTLRNEYKNTFLINIFAHDKDFIEKYLTGYDRNSILYQLYQ